MYKTLNSALVHAHGLQAKATVYTDASCTYFVEEGHLTTKDALPRQIALLYHVAPSGYLRDCLTQDQVRSAAQPIAEKNRGRFACGIVGHTLLVRSEGSGLTETRFCARCGDPVPHLEGQVPLGINLRANRDAFKKLDWRHKIYGISEPFGPKYRINNY